MSGPQVPCPGQRHDCRFDPSTVRQVERRSNKGTDARGSDPRVLALSCLNPPQTPRPPELFWFGYPRDLLTCLQAAVKECGASSYFWRWPRPSQDSLFFPRSARLHERKRVIAMQLCMPTCRSGSSWAVRCLFAWRSYGGICSAILAGLRPVGGDAGPLAN